MLVGTDTWAQDSAPVIGARSSVAEPAMALHGGLSMGTVGVRFDEGEVTWRPSYRLELGLRFPVWHAGPLRAVRLTPKIALDATHLSGMDPATDRYGYASVDVAVRATYAMWRIRPYVETRMGSQCAERADTAREILDFNGAGRGFGVGLEIPMSKSGRGLELGVTIRTGKFDRFEFHNIDSPADIHNRAITFHLGWSGRLTGISLPWQ